MDFLEYKKEARVTENLDIRGIGNRASIDVNARMLHAAIGLSTEIAELIEGVKKQDDVNVKEEIGDCMWYIATAANCLFEEKSHLIQIKIIKSHDEMKRLSESPINCLDNLVQLSSSILDDMKKVIFYGKREINQDFIDKIENKLSEVTEYLYTLAAYYNITLSDCCITNINKLQGVRYQNGFTATDAENRDLNKEEAILKSNNSTNN